MGDPTKVTALVPAYQAAAFIQPTLDSLSQQTLANFNVIISVDLCDDDTHAICVKQAERDSRFRVIRQSQRLGYVGNCNFLLDQADSEYVLFAFHDDILAPSYVEKLCAVLDNKPQVIISYSDVLLTPVDGEQEHLIFTELEGISNPVHRGLKMLNRPSLWWVPNRGIFRLGAARRIQGLKMHGAGEFSADFPWLFHMSLLGEFARVPETLCFKYFKPGSLSKSWAFTRRQQYEVTAACMREIWISDLTTHEKLVLTAPLTTWLFKTYPRIKGEAVTNDHTNDTL
jgi:glycosyltransferase involved in cell wall biosynthesis